MHGQPLTDARMVNEKTIQGARQMKKIQILGTGCPKCKKLAEVTEKVGKESRCGI